MSKEDKKAKKLAKIAKFHQKQKVTPNRPKKVVLKSVGYNPKDVEKRWSDFWDENCFFMPEFNEHVKCFCDFDTLVGFSYRDYITECLRRQSFFSHTDKHNRPTDVHDESKGASVCMVSLGNKISLKDSYNQGLDINDDLKNLALSNFNCKKCGGPLRRLDPRPFVVPLPPPNVTGKLHLGHAYMLSIQDVIVRYYRMHGRPVLFLPGTDHAGIATQTVVEKTLAKQLKNLKINKTGKSRAANSSSGSGKPDSIPERDDNYKIDAPDHSNNPSINNKNLKSNTRDTSSMIYEADIATDKRSNPISQLNSSFDSKDHLSPRHILGRYEFIKRVNTWAIDHSAAIYLQMKKVGASFDLSRKRFTLDDDYSKSVLKAFCELYDRGLIYRGSKIVYYCSLLRTTLSDLEVVSKDIDGFEKVTVDGGSYVFGVMYYFRYPLLRVKRQNEKVASTQDSKGDSNNDIVSSSDPDNKSKTNSKSPMFAEIHFCDDQSDYGAKCREVYNLSDVLPSTTRISHIDYYLEDLHALPYVIVGTTRPETIIGDSGLCFNTKDKRRHILENFVSVNPLTRRCIPILFDDVCSLDVGSGCLKVTPCHDMNDFDLGSKYALDFVKVLDEDNRITLIDVVLPIQSLEKDHLGMNCEEYLDVDANSESKYNTCSLENPIHHNQTTSRNQGLESGHPVTHSSKSLNIGPGPVVPFHPSPARKLDLIYQKTIYKLENQKRFEARVTSKNLLESLNLLNKAESHKQILPFCQRSNDILEFSLKDQWFLKCDGLAERVLNTDYVFYPKEAEKVWRNWLLNIKDWCLSRQLWYGHRIPAFRVVCKKQVCWVVGDSHEKVLTGFLRLFEDGNLSQSIDTDTVRTNPNPSSNDQMPHFNISNDISNSYNSLNEALISKLEKITFEYKGKQYQALYDKAQAVYQIYHDNSEYTLTQDEDVLDTWFSSGLWPFATLGWGTTNYKDSESNFIRAQHFQSPESENRDDTDHKNHSQNLFDYKTFSKNISIYENHDDSKELDALCVNVPKNHLYGCALKNNSNVRYSDESSRTPSNFYKFSAHKDFTRLFPVNILETGYDILFFWVARMAMLSQELTNEKPFNKIILHGIIRDSIGRKMSKSLGNVIDPLYIINGIHQSEMITNLQNAKKEGIINEEEYQKAMETQAAEFPEGIRECGADALRFSLTSMFCNSKDVCLDMQRVFGYRKMCNKIYNTHIFYQNMLKEDNTNYEQENTQSSEDFDSAHRHLKNSNDIETVLDQSAEKTLIEIDSINIKSCSGNSIPINSSTDNVTSESATLVDLNAINTLKNNFGLHNVWIINERNKTIEAYNKSIHSMNLMGATQAIQKLFLTKFCDTYIEIIKKTKTTSDVLIFKGIYRDILAMFSPFMPFITEDIYQKIREVGEAPSITVMEFPQKIGISKYIQLCTSKTRFEKISRQEETSLTQNKSQYLNSCLAQNELILPNQLGKFEEILEMIRNIRSNCENLQIKKYSLELNTTDKEVVRYLRILLRNCSDIRTGCQVDDIGFRIHKSVENE